MRTTLDPHSLYSTGATSCLETSSPTPTRPRPRSLTASLTTGTAEVIGVHSLLSTLRGRGSDKASTDGALSLPDEKEPDKPPTSLIFSVDFHRRYLEIPLRYQSFVSNVVGEGTYHTFPRYRGGVQF